MPRSGDRLTPRKGALSPDLWRAITLALALAAASAVVILWWGFVRRPATDRSAPGLDRMLQMLGAASVELVGVAAVPLMLGPNDGPVRLASLWS